MRLGLMILGDLVPDPHTGRVASQAERHRAFVELAVLAEEVGLDSVWLGEHHFCDYILSSPAIVLAAIAERTSRIRLGTSVALLPNLDPVRVAEDYATLDLLSGGRVELAVGRGIVPRVYEGFGQDPEDARTLQEERLELLLRLWTEQEVDWEGTTRAPIRDLRVEPHPAQRPHPPVWLGGGSSKASAELAGRLGLGLLLPSVLAPPEAFLAQVEHYREHFRPAPGGPPAPTVGACSHVHVGPDAASARARWEPYHMGYLDWLGDVVRWGGGTPRPAPYEAMLAGPSICGGPTEVADRLAAMRDTVGLDVHLAMFDHGGMPTDLVGETIARYADEVAPLMGHDVPHVTSPPGKL
jgi:alkanesulfonate monooxygenase SsuD/methylene tetrahydromethanopterin reductase-like flavin-dependent oxidoreductase (luciferase family)